MQKLRKRAIFLTSPGLLGDHLGFIEETKGLYYFDQRIGMCSSSKFKLFKSNCRDQKQASQAKMKRYKSRFWGLQCLFEPENIEFLA